MEPRTALIVPCYNEEATIADVVHSYLALDPSVAVYVYDNNSADRTAELARAAGAHVVSEHRQGKGFAVRSAFRDIEADVYLLVDGDATYDAADVLALRDDVLSGRADMVVGDRLGSGYFEENKRPLHNAGNRVVRWLINQIFGAAITDVMTGARAFSRRFVKSYPGLVGGFEIETEMTIHALDKDFPIAQRPVRYTDRREGSHSKLSTYSDGGRVLWTIVALFKDFRPLQFFGIATVFLSVASVGLMIAPVVGYLETGLVEKFPSLIVAVGLGVAAMLSMTAGVILDSIRKQTRTFFEIELTRVAGERPCGTSIGSTSRREP